MTRLARPTLTVALVAAALAACSRREPLPVLGTIPAFTLTSQADAPVTAESLRGRVWVANFIFTRCPTICPGLTQRMRQVRERLPAGPDGVQAVSLSVDPAHDTPAVLRDYASRHGAAGPDWTFLTGPREAIQSLLRDGFMVPFSDDGPPEQPITHGDRFVLVDRGLRIRGYYRGMEPEALEQLVVDARALAAEDAP